MIAAAKKRSMLLLQLFFKIAEYFVLPFCGTPLELDFGLASDCRARSFTVMFAGKCTFPAVFNARESKRALG